jgi:hypothetical protein
LTNEEIAKRFALYIGENKRMNEIVGSEELINLQAEQWFFIGAGLESLVREVGTQRAKELATELIEIMSVLHDSLRSDA